MQQLGDAVPLLQHRAERAFQGVDLQLLPRLLSHLGLGRVGGNSMQKKLALMKALLPNRTPEELSEMVQEVPVGGCSG